MKDKIVGVVAEFNPFHNGHKYQIDEIEKENPKIKIAVISGDFTQRGDFSIIDKFEKAKIAILNGYDIILELPCYYAIQNADVFSEYAIKILNEAKVQIQVFGIEDNNLDNIEKIVNLKNDISYNERIRELLKEGNSYIKSNEIALNERNFKNVYKSNNILAISYVNSIKKYGLNIDYKGIKRKNVDYNSSFLNLGIASATFIRKNILDDEILKQVTVKESFEILKNDKNICDYNVLYNLFRMIFTRNSKEDICNIYDFNDSIYNMFKKVVYNADTYDEFLLLLNKRNISINRIKRLLLNVILDIRKSDIYLGNKIEYIRVLSFNQKGAKYLKTLGNKFFVNWKDIEKNIFSNLINIEKRAFLLKKILNGKKEKLNSIFVKGGDDFYNK